MTYYFLQEDRMGNALQNSSKKPEAIKAKMPTLSEPPFSSHEWTQLLE
jgi:hypothetical protein